MEVIDCANIYSFCPQYQYQYIAYSKDVTDGSLWNMLNIVYIKIVNLVSVLFMILTNWLNMLLVE